MPISAEEAAALFFDLADESRLLVAVSGGPDSIALLALLQAWAAGPGRPILSAATIDHGLRSASADEAEAVGVLCRRLGVDHAILRWTGAKPATGIQARARSARYDLLAAESLRIGASVLVTAHHADDQAETLLMRLAHGSGPAGLIGMTARSRRNALVLARPLLEIPKARLLATVQALDLPFATDPGNAEPRFERVRWRALAPALASEGLDAIRLATLSRRLARMEAALDERAGRLLQSLALPEPRAGVRQLAFRLLVEEPEELALRVLASMLAHADGGRVRRLERLETCLAALLAGAREGRAVTRTLAGCVLALSRSGVLSIRREGVRRRGVHPEAFSCVKIERVSLGKAARRT